MTGFNHKYFQPRVINLFVDKIKISANLRFLPLACAFYVALRI